MAAVCTPRGGGGRFSAHITFNYCAVTVHLPHADRCRFSLDSSRLRDRIIHLFHALHTKTGPWLASDPAFSIHLLQCTNSCKPPLPAALMWSNEMAWCTLSRCACLFSQPQPPLPSPPSLPIRSCSPLPQPIPNCPERNRLHTGYTLRHSELGSSKPRLRRKTTRVQGSYTLCRPAEGVSGGAPPLGGGDVP